MVVEEEEEGERRKTRCDSRRAIERSRDDEPEQAFKTASKGAEELGP